MQLRAYMYLSANKRLDYRNRSLCYNVRIIPNPFLKLHLKWGRAKKLISNKNKYLLTPFLRNSNQSVFYKGRISLINRNLSLGSFFMILVIKNSLCNLNQYHCRSNFQVVCKNNAFVYIFDELKFWKLISSPQQKSMAITNHRANFDWSLASIEM